MSTLGLEEMRAFGKRARQDPIWGAKEMFGVSLWPKQQQIIRSVWDNDRTAVVSCHSIGKSFLTAVAVVMFLLTHADSYVLLTAPTWRQICDVVWREIRNLYARSKFDLPGEPLITPKWEIGPKWMCLGFSCKEPERVHGYHARYVLVVVDEASGVPDKLFPALNSLLASGVKLRLLLLSNGTRSEGELYDAFHSKAHVYPGRFTVSCWDTPNLAPIKDACMAAATNEERWKIMREWPVPKESDFLINGGYVAKNEQEFGIDSDVYRVRCLGQFPKGAPDQLVPLHKVEEACYRWDEMFFPKDPKFAKPKWWENLKDISHLLTTFGGLDIARKGNNETVLTARLEDIVAPQEGWVGIDTVQMLGFARPAITAKGIRHLRVDEIGLGGGPFDQLRYWAPPGMSIEGFNGSLPASNKEHFANIRAEGFWGLRQRYMQGRIAHKRTPKLVGQVAAMKFKYRANGQIIMTSKDEMLAAGQPSPDYADSLMMAYANYLGEDALPPEHVAVTANETTWDFDALADLAGGYHDGYG